MKDILINKTREEKYNCPCCGKEMVKLDYGIEYTNLDTEITSVTDVYECLSCLQKIVFL